MNVNKIKITFQVMFLGVVLLIPLGIHAEPVSALDRNTQLKTTEHSSVNDRAANKFIEQLMKAFAGGGSKEIKADKPADKSYPKIFGQQTDAPSNIEAFKKAFKSPSSVLPTSKVKPLRDKFSDLEVHFNEKNGIPIFLKAKKLYLKDQNVPTGKAALAVRNLSDIALSSLHEYKDIFQIQNPFEEFQEKQDIPDPLGLKHLKFQQTYKGIPVWGKELIVHFDQSEDVYLINGVSLPTVAIDTNPEIFSNQAIDRIKNDMPGTTNFSTPELVIHADDNFEFKRLAYHVIVHKGFEEWKYFVDAKTGAIAEKYNNTKRQSVPASGLDLNGQTQDFSVWKQDSYYYMIDTSLPMHAQDPSATSLGKGNIIILDARNKKTYPFYYVISLSTNSGWDDDAVSLLKNIKITADYYKTTFDRNSFDNNGSNITGVIHLDQNYDNAFWNGTFMTFGDGGVQFSSLANGLDIVAHEFTHAVTQYSAHLEYKYQSGALNEAFSDIFAAMIDRDDWLMGEDVAKNTLGFLRNLKDPCQANSPASMEEYQVLPITEDNGGVHKNSTIPSRAAYLIAEGLTQEGLGTSIGRDKTEQIFYKALTQHLTTQSDFYSARLATIQSAEELYGVNTPEVQAVKLAWDTVGVKEKLGGSGGTEVTPIQNNDNLLFIGGPYLGNYYLFVKLSNGQEKQVSTTPVGLTRPVVTGDGKQVLFVDTHNNVKLACLPPSTCNEVSLTTNGTIRTIAGSQNGRYYAYTTTEYDNLVYVFDASNNSVTPIELYAPNDANMKIGIAYADVIDFTLSGNKIIYDAVNKLDLGGYTYEYWNVGMVDIADINNPIVENIKPTLPLGYHIKNPATANTKEWLIAGEVIDEITYFPFTVSRTYTYNLLKQKEGFVAYTTTYIGRPAFNGDDTFVATQYQGSIHKVPIIKNGDAFEGEGVLNNASIITKDAYYPKFYRVGSRDIKPNIRISKTSFNFGEVRIGEMVTDTLTMTNDGNFDLVIDSIDLADKTNFTQNGSHAVIAPGNSVNITLSFKPTTAGIKTTALSIGTNDPVSPAANIALSGTGVTQSYALTTNKSGAGSGTITSSPAGIDCGSTCSASYDAGTQVTLTAATATGSTFAGWSGACSGTTCTVTMDAAKSVTATFNVSGGGTATSVSLSQGWNLISLPKRPPASTTIETVLADITPNVRIVWGYDNQTKQWLKHRPAGSSQYYAVGSNTLATMEAGKGYWVYMNAPGNIDMSNWTAQSPAVPLTEGWNLIGYNGTDNTGATTVLNNISNKWTIIWNWTGGQWYAKQSSSPGSITAQPLNSFCQGKAYWIKTTEAVEWNQ